MLQAKGSLGDNSELDLVLERKVSAETTRDEGTRVMPQTKASQFLSTPTLLAMGRLACRTGIMAHVLHRLLHSAANTVRVPSAQNLQLSRASFNWPQGPEQNYSS